MKRQILKPVSLLLALVMILSLVPVSALSLFETELHVVSMEIVDAYPYYENADGTYSTVASDPETGEYVDCEKYFIYRYEPEDFNFKLTYSDGSVIYTNHEWPVDDLDDPILMMCDQRELGKKWEKGGENNILTISYGGGNCTHNVEIIDNDITSIEITRLPTKTEYLISQSLNLDGGEVTVYHADGKIEVDDLKLSGTVTGFFPYARGKQTLTYEYGGFTDTFEVEVFEYFDTVPISTKEELNAIRNDLDEHYYLTNDIVFTDEDFEEGGAFYNDGLGWIPIGTEDDPFEGSLNGRGFTIKNLTINGVEEDLESESPVYNVGLFGYASGYAVENLGMVDADIFVSVDKGTINAGAIVGKSPNGMGNIPQCRVENCHSTGDIVIEAETSNVGGLLGCANTTIISTCYNNADVVGDTNVGGIAGFDGSGVFGADLNGCYNTGSVLAVKNAGGILGKTTSLPRMYNCYNVGSVSTYEFEDSYSGGIIGSAGSGILKTENCYYLNNNEAGVGDGGGTPISENSVIKCTQEQMTTQSTFVGFDFETVWTMEGRDDYLYPELRDVPMVELQKLETMSSLVELPTKLEYVQGKEDLDLTGGKIKIYYNTGEIEVVDLSNATVSGFDNSRLGTQTLTVEYGVSTFTFDVTVVEAPPEPPVVTEPTEIEIRDNSPFEVNAVQNCITGIQPSTTVAGLKANLENDSTKIRVVNSRGGNINRAVLATGDKVQLILGGRVLDEKTIVVLGDVSGEGIINVQDVKKVLNDSINKTNLKGVYALAADVNGNGKVDVPDVKKVLNVSIGKASSF